MARARFGLAEPSKARWLAGNKRGLLRHGPVRPEEDLRLPDHETMTEGNRGRGQTGPLAAPGNEARGERVGQNVEEPVEDIFGGVKGNGAVVFRRPEDQRFSKRP